MMEDSLERRSLEELLRDSSGQLMTEWTLVTAAVVISFGLLAPAMIHMLDIYFYRIAGVIALPFP